MQLENTLRHLPVNNLLGQGLWSVDIGGKVSFSQCLCQKIIVCEK